ncbi:hypothetical protein [Actinoplanes subglobosus]|uniref:Uncharacterized protein n=1 Tax=Actinoplanes subglobosus TaxID=1547892 RepID=A0ABV8J0K9_9ACTN
MAGSVRVPESRQDLLDWVDAGLPPIWTWCDYSIARGHSTGEMHEIRIVGEAVALTHHDAAARDGEIVRAEARGRHLACYAMAEALASDQPINGATAAAWRLGRDAAKRLKRMRSIWTAYRWIRAGRDLDAMDPAVLGHPLGAAASQFLAVPARPPVVVRPVWAIPDADGSLPSQVREALAALTPKAAVTTPRQLVALVEGGLPPARLRCDGVMHQIQVVGDQLRLRDHDDTDVPSACHGLAESIRGAEPLTRTGRKEAGYPRQHPGEFLSSTQTRRAEQVRTVWLAYRWLKAGHTLDEVGPLLVRGPGPEHGGEWLDAGVAAQQVAAWYGYQDLAGCLRWRRSPHVDPAASLALDEARSSGRWTMRACLALLGDVRRRPPYRYIDDSELKEALRRMRTEATGPAGTADGDLHDWLHRGWIRVTTPDDCLTYRAVLTASGLRRLVALWIRSSWFRQHDLSPPAHVDENFREVLRFAELVKLLRQADVHEVTVDSSGSITLTNKFDGPTDLADVDRLGLQRRGGPRQRFDRSQRNAVIEHTSAVAARHGMPLRIDLRRMTAEGSQTRGLAAGAHWCDTVPALLADAIAMVDPAMQPASADEFRHWVEAGLPTVEVRCGEETHQLNVVGERIVYTAHDSALREEDEFMAALSGEPIACYATGETLSGTEPLLDPDDTYRRGEGVLLAAYRTVWLAYRWPRSPRDRAAPRRRARTGAGRIMARRGCSGRPGRRLAAAARPGRLSALAVLAGGRCGAGRGTRQVRHRARRSGRMAAARRACGLPCRLARPHSRRLRNRGGGPGLGRCRHRR